jgi:serine protease Do
VKALWLGLLALMSLSLARAQEPDDMIIVRRLSTHVMQVRGATLGSAVALGEHLAVTNCHVLGDRFTVDVMRGGLGSTASVKAGDTGHDLCLLEVESSPSFPVKLGRATALAPGHKVYAIGFGAGRLSFGAGTIEALYPYEDSFIIRTDAPFGAGASGGALFDSQANLVGVLTFFRRGAQTSSYWAMPPEWIIALTDSKSTTVDRSRLPIWSEKRAASIVFLEVAAREIDGEWREMRERAQQWLLDDPGNQHAIRALHYANSKLLTPY